MPLATNLPTDKVPGGPDHATGHNTTNTRVNEVATEVNAHEAALDNLSPFNVKDYGAVGNGSTNDTTAIQAAIDACNTAGGGIVHFPTGTYITNLLTVYSRVRLIGAGRNATTIKLAASANTDLIRSYQFSTLTGTTSSGGLEHFGISDLTLDGNKAAQTTGIGACLKHYGCLIHLERVVARNARGAGIYSEWNTAAVATDGCEGLLYGLSLHDNDGCGLEFYGPHDSVLTDSTAWHNTDTGFYFGPGGIVSASNCHSWGTETQNYAWYMEEACYLENCQGEGATIAQVVIAANSCTVIGGKYYAGVASGSKGILVGDATHTSISGTRIMTTVENIPGGALDLTYSAGLGHISLNAYSGTGGIGVIGGPIANEVTMVTTSSPSGALTGFNGVSVAGSIQLGTPVGLGTLGGRLFSGSGAPSGFASLAGDYYLRTDTPSTANQRIYVCTAAGTPGTWVGIA